MVRAAARGGGAEAKEGDVARRSGMIVDFFSTPRRRSLAGEEEEGEDPASARTENRGGRGCSTSSAVREAGRPQRTTLRCFHPSALRVLGMVGVGKTAITVKAELAGHGLVAVKCIPASESLARVGEDGDAPIRLPFEVLLHSTLRHQRIPRLLGVCLDGTEILMVQDYVAGAGADEGSSSDLWTLLHGGGGPARPLKPSRAAAIATDVAEALEHLHLRGVLHCDLSPKNILVSAQGRAFLTDFGCSRPALPADLQAEAAAAESPVASRGCVNYLAPEVIAGGGEACTPKSDMYGLGGVLLEMLDGKAPWSGMPDCVIEHEAGVWGRSPLDGRAAVEKCGELAEIVGALLSLEPNSRPSAAELRRALARIVEEEKEEEEEDVLLLI